jgi:hypothetical protein
VPHRAGGLGLVRVGHAKPFAWGFLFALPHPLAHTHTRVAQIEHKPLA